MTDTHNRKSDPHFEREAAKYPNPIPSREFIMDFLRERGQPARRAEIIQAFNLDSDEEQEALRRRLRAMERDGQLIFTRRGGYGLVEKMNLIPGRVIGHKEGYGFVSPEEGDEDIFLNAYQMRSVFDGDRVLVRVVHVDRKGRLEGEVVDVLERAHEEFVGRFFQEHGMGFVTPENQRISQDILIPVGQENGARNGQYVLVRILFFPTSRNQGVGHVVEVIGDHMAPGMETDVAIRAYGLPYQWSDAVNAEISNFSEIVPDTDKKDRVDLRKKAFVTIDGEDAKDFDDAVYCERNGKNGWKLYVAIADVSCYVKPNTLLDAEAKKRGNSVYFPGRVIPMLPEILSNGLCSLRPDQDRLAMVCEMTLSEDGKVRRYKFYEAVIYSHARMTYTNVAKILIDNHLVLRKQYQQLIPYLENLYHLYQILATQREYRGAINFETIETKVVFGKDRKIEAIVPVIRNEAHKIIEECMLLANVCAARFLHKNKLPALYRVHEGPSETKLSDLRKFLGELGLSLKGGKTPKPKDYADLIKQIQGRAEQRLVQTVLLRSLSQAVYSPDNAGHFGLAYEAYSHFTSPIRRYPDLIVHRLIRSALQSHPLQLSEQELGGLGEHCSMTERRADEATRDVLFWLKCEFMQDRVGEEFDGIITGVTGFGLFVELEDIFVEGLVHITALENDYFQFDPIKHWLIGERTRVCYRLADKIRVKLVRVDLDSRKIDFTLTQTGLKPKAKTKSRKARIKRKK